VHTFAIQFLPEKCFFNHGRASRGLIPLERDSCSFSAACCEIMTFIPYLDGLLRGGCF